MFATARILLVTATALALTACPPGTSDAGPEPDPDVVSIAGDHGVVVGETLQLTASTSPGDDDSYTWSSSDTSVATVDADGLVTAVAAGEAAITATGDDTDASASHAVVVMAATPGPAAMVSIAGEHRVDVDGMLTLSASTVNGTDASYLWQSSSTGIATVNQSGQVTGIAAGEATISATGSDTGAVGTFVLVVTALPDPGEPAVVVSGDFYIVLGGTTQLSATTVNGTDASYTWMSSDDLVASVDDTGLVTAHRAGEVTITATGSDTAVAGTLGLVAAQTIPYFDQWAASGHADYDAEAFTHWDEDGEVEVSCARCHSPGGFADYVGADGSAFGTIEQPAPIGGVIDCNTCHSSAANALSEVTFPSGETLTGVGPEARCMTCHQGRASTDNVDQAILDAAAADDDTPSADLGFINIHYYAAGATLNAGKVRGGYQYANQTYDTRFRHVPDRDSCIECHNQHTLEVRIESCQSCHTAVTDVDSLKDIRMIASAGTDYDGDGNLAEGIYYEMVGLRDIVYAQLQAYATQQGNPICYSAESYPYFFNDSDSSGACEASEANFGNRYVSWTNRMLRAAYNYQVALKDPGAFAHNAKYIMQLLYDAAADLNTALSSPTDLSATRRTDPGHFNGAGEAARHWDEDEGVSASCSRCHSGSEGFRFYVEYGVGTTVLEQDNGLDCATCHTTFGDVEDPADAYGILTIEDVTFPNGVTIHNPDDPGGNICSTCHQGRESGASVEAAIDAGNFRFLNVHYLAAGSTIRGSDVGIGVQYETKSYDAASTTHTGGSRCTSCHSPINTNHSFDANDNLSFCLNCHTGISDVQEIRTTDHTADYDGDGSSTEHLVDEMSDLAMDLLDALNTRDGLCWSPDSYPYFFVDGNTSGPMCDAGEANYGNRFNAYDETSMRAVFNFQLWATEHGLWAHNFDYGAQLLIDSIEDVAGAGAVAGYVRPTAN